MIDTTNTDTSTPYVLIARVLTTYAPTRDYMHGRYRSRLALAKPRSIRTRDINRDSPGSLPESAPLPPILQHTRILAYTCTCISKILVCTLDGGNVSDVSQPSLETCFQAWKHKWKQSGNSRKQSETINIDKSLHVYTAVDVGRRV